MDGARGFPVGMGDYVATTVPGDVEPTPRKRGWKEEGAADEWPYWLPDGWIMKTRLRKDGKFNKSYICPISGHTFHSAEAVLHYLHFVLPPQELGYNRDNADDLSLQTEGGFNDHVCNYNSLSAPQAESPVWLPRGWIMEVKVRMSGKTAGYKYKCYNDSVTGSKFYLKNDVIQYLEGDKFNIASKDETTESDTFDSDMILSRFEGSVDGLLCGWIKETRFKTRASGIRRDSYYTDPKSGIVFRTKKDVLHYLETGEVSKYCYKKKGKHLRNSPRTKEFSVCSNVTSFKPCDLARIFEQGTLANNSIITSSVGNTMEVVELLADESPCQNLQLALPQGIESTDTNMYMLLEAYQLEENPGQTVNANSSKVTCIESCSMGPLPQEAEPGQQSELVSVPNTNTSPGKLLNAVDTDTLYLESKEPAPTLIETKETKTTDPASKEQSLSISERKEVDHHVDGCPPVTPKPMVYMSHKKLAVRKPSSMRRAYTGELHANLMGKELEPLETGCPANMPKPEVPVRTLEKPSPNSCTSPDSCVFRLEEPAKVLASTCLQPIVAGEPAKPEKPSTPYDLLPRTLIKQLEAHGNLSTSPEPIKPVFTKTPEHSSRSNETMKEVPCVFVPSQSSSRSPPKKSTASIDLPSGSLFGSLSPMKTTIFSAKKLPECSFEARGPMIIAAASTDMIQASSKITKPVKVAATAGDEPTEISSTRVVMKKSTSHELPYESSKLMKSLEQGPHSSDDPIQAPVRLVAYSCKEQTQISSKSSWFQSPEKATPASAFSDKVHLPPLVQFDSVHKQISEVKTTEATEPEDMSCELLEEKPSEKRTGTKLVVSVSRPSSCFENWRGAHLGKGKDRDCTRTVPHLSESDVLCELVNKISVRGIVEVLDKVSAGNGHRDWHAAGSSRGKGRKRAPQTILWDSKMKQKKSDVPELGLSESEDGSFENLKEKPPTQVSSNTSSVINDLSPRDMGSSRVGSMNNITGISFNSSKQKEHDVQVVNMFEQEDMSSELAEVNPTNENPIIKEAVVQTVNMYEKECSSSELVKVKSTDRTAKTEDPVSSSSRRHMQGGSSWSRTQNSCGGRGKSKGEKIVTLPFQLSVLSVAAETSFGVSSKCRHGSQRGTKSRRSKSRGRGSTNSQRMIATPSDNSMTFERDGTVVKISSSISSPGIQGSSRSCRGRGKKGTPHLRSSMRLAGINPSAIILDAGSPPILRRSTRLK